MSLSGKTVLVGVSGGIAAYKTCEVVRLLRKDGAIVHVAMTQAAGRFVAPLTFAALSANPVLENVWDMSDDGQIRHVLLGHAAQAMVVAPATANTMARLAGGFADDALSALALSSQCPVLLAPAMETAMWQNALTQRNVNTLLATGRFSVVGPERGALASGHSGVGRMSEPGVIAWHVARLCERQDWRGRHLVVSAGPTREAIDPIRFLSNRSSGKMGFALAERAAQRGARVTLVHGPVALSPPLGVQAVAVTSAAEMLAALQHALLGAHALIMAAAVADYGPSAPAAHKLKKAELGPTASLALAETPDIVATLAAARGDTLLVGFAAETQNVEANARAKLASKGLDLIVSNDVSVAGIGMDADDNRVIIYDETGSVADTGVRSKRDVADQILDVVRKRLR